MARKGMQRYRAYLMPVEPYRQELKRFDMDIDKPIYTWAFSKAQAIRNFIVRYPEQEFYAVTVDSPVEVS